MVRVHILLATSVRPVEYVEINTSLKCKEGTQASDASVRNLGMHLTTILMMMMHLKRVRVMMTRLKRVQMMMHVSGLVLTFQVIINSTRVKTTN